MLRIDPETGGQEIFLPPDQPEAFGDLAQVCGDRILVGGSGADPERRNRAVTVDPDTAALQSELRFPDATNFQVDIAVSSRGQLLILGLHGVQRYDFARLFFEEVAFIGARTAAMVVVPGTDPRKFGRCRSRRPRVGRSLNR